MRTPWHDCPASTHAALHAASEPLGTSICRPAPVPSHQQLSHAPFFQVQAGATAGTTGAEALPSFSVFVASSSSSSSSSSSACPGQPGHAAQGHLPRPRGDAVRPLISRPDLTQRAEDSRGAARRGLGGSAGVACGPVAIRRGHVGVRYDDTLPLLLLLLLPLHLRCRRHALISTRPAL